MTTDSTHLQQLREIAGDLSSILSRLDAHDALIAAAHVQSALEAVRSMADLPQDRETDPTDNDA